MFDAARRAGVDVTLDTYPYLAGATYLHAILPSWVHEGGTDAVLKRLQDPAMRTRIRHEVEVAGSDSWHDVPVDWGIIQIGGIVGGHDPWAIGMRLDAAAAKAGMTPFDYFCDLLVRTRLGVTQIAFIGNEENVQAILQHPIHMVGSDGILPGDHACFARVNGRGHDFGYDGANLREIFSGHVFSFPKAAIPIIIHAVLVYSQGNVRTPQSDPVSLPGRGSLREKSRNRLR